MKRTVTLFFAILLTQLSFAQNSVKITFESAFSFNRMDDAYALIVYANSDKELYKSNRFGQVHFTPVEENFSVIFYSNNHETLSTHFDASSPLKLRVIMTPNKLPPIKNDDENVLLNARILDELSGQPVTGASISIADMNIQLTTNELGEFNITHQMLGSLDSKMDSIPLKISSPGYKTFETLIINSTLTTYSKYELQPATSINILQSEKMQNPSLEKVIFSESTSPMMLKSNCSPLPSTIRVGTNCSCNSCANVTVLSLETYVQQGLNDEWIASWMTESLKAGSLPYRTYGAYYIQNPYSANYDLASTTCKQVWDSDYSNSCVNAAISTSGEYLVNSLNSIAFSEYSAENNGLGAPSGLGCGNGFAGTGSTSPCISDNVCSGYSRQGHGRGMCQWGSQRWAQQGQLYDWIVDHYYNPASIFRCSSSSSNTLDCTNAIPLTCGVTFTNGASNASSNVMTYGCNNWTETGPERVHTITPTGNGTLTATISNFSGDLDVYILGSCDPNDCLGTVLSASASYSNAQAGQTYYIVVDSDNGSGSGYDILVDCPPGSASEDIFITNTSISSSTLSPGANFTVYATQNYSGTQLDANLPSFDLDYYLSTDCNLDNGDVLLGGDVSGLGSDDPFNDEDADLTIPIGTALGNYYILFAADNDDELVESDETNNLACIAITVGASTEDIFLTNVSVSNTSLMPGDNFTVYATQNYAGNQLDANLPSFDLDYYLSTDCNLDNGDVLLGGDISGLGSDDPFQDEQANLTIPAGTASGNYYILFAADNDAELVEQNESNNIECVAITVGTTNPEDIYLSGVFASPQTLAAGDNIFVTATHSYSGSQTTSQLPTFDLDYFLSSDCNLDNSDILLGGDPSSLGSNDPFEDEDANLTIPNGTVPGIYYILFIADSDNDLVEQNEANNMECIQIEITGGSTTEDISISNVTTNQTSVVVGNSVFVTAQQTYAGTQLSTALNDVALAYYLSFDCALSTDDVYIGGDFSTIGSDIPTEVETADLSIPSSTIEGNYFILFVGDANDDFSEVNEQNNVQCLPLYVFNTNDVSDLNDFDLEIYPNPISNLLQIDNCMGMRLEMVDNTGRIVHQQTCTANHVEIDVSKLAASMYTLHFTIDGHHLTSKVIKL